MPENLLRVAQCSIEGDKSIWEMVLTDERSIFVNHGKVKTPGLWWGLAGGAGGYALGFLLTKQETGGSVTTGGLEAMAGTVGNRVVPHASVKKALLERGFGVWKSLTLEYGDPSGPLRLKALVAAPEAYVQARREAGLGRLASQREFTEGFREDLLRILPPNVVAKDKWK